MSTNILIPAKVVLENGTAPLILAAPKRCSRCGAPMTDYFESHSVKFQAGNMGYRQFGSKYRMNIFFTLRLPLCETCYQVNFIEDADSCASDATPLGRLAHRHAVSTNIATVLAGAAFILLMKVIPLPESLPWLQQLWLILVGAALLVFGTTYLLLWSKKRLLRESLQGRNNLKLHRAEVFAGVLSEEPKPDDPAVTVKMENQEWAEECAVHYHWLVGQEQTESGEEEVK